MWRKTTLQRLGLMLLAALLLLSFWAMQPNSTYAAGDFYVAPGGNDAGTCDTTATPCATIQAAINKAAAGNTVHVAAGTYNETLIVDKALKLEGVQKGVLAKGRPGPQSVIRVASGGTVALDIRSDNVTADGFVFNITGATTPWAIIAINEGVDGRFANLKLLNNEFLANSTAGTSGGAYLYNTDNARIEGNYFNALGNHAIFMAGSTTAPVYYNNDSYRCYNSNFSTHDNGTTGGLIEGNRAVEDDMILFKFSNGIIRNNTLTGTSSASSRFYLGGGNDFVQIINNVLTGFRSTGIIVQDAGFGYGPPSNIQVVSNTLTANVGLALDNYSLIDFRDVGGNSLIADNLVTLSGSYTAPASATYAVGLRGNLGTVQVNGNTLDGGNVVTTGTPKTSGVLIRTNGLSATANISVKNNISRNFGNGMAVYNFSTNTYGGIPATATVEASQNSFTGNSDYGLVSGPGAQINAERNWWGSSTGPAPTGTGNKVSDNVDFDPWLCDGTDTQPNIRGFQPNLTSSPCSITTSCDRPSVSQLSHYRPSGDSNGQPNPQYPLSNLVDVSPPGNNTAQDTFWAWTNYPRAVALQVDFGAGNYKTVSAIKLFSHDPTKAPNNYFQFSQDGVTWYDIPGLNMINTNPAYGLNTYNVSPAITARLFRIVTDNTTFLYDIGYWSDLQICSQSPTGTPTNGATLPKVSHQLPITSATSPQGGNPANVLDGQSWTNWLVNGNPGSAVLTVNLGTTRTITSLTYFVTNSAGPNSTKVEVLTSSGWVTIANGVNTGGYTYGNQTLPSFALVQGSQIRFTVTNTSNSWGVGGYGDIKAFGY